LNPRHQLTFLARRADTAGAYTLWLDQPQAGFGPARHVHDREEEMFFLLEGEATFHAGDQTLLAHPGAFIGLPKGIPHSWKEGSVRGCLFSILTPPASEGFFFDLGIPAAEPPPDPKSEPDIRRINEVANKYGVSYFGPDEDPSLGYLPSGVGRKPNLLPPDAGEVYSARGVHVVLKASGTQTDRAYTFVEYLLAPGGEVPLHQHGRYEEGIFIRSGTVAVRMDDQLLEANPGSYFMIPPGKRHAIHNPGEQMCRVLSLTLPAGIEEFYRSAYHPMKGVSEPAKPLTTEDIERLQKLGVPHGVEFAMADPSSFPSRK
jgi:quercetin dioxygenase-like cupin family protein